jgi:hypothetical protein
MIYMCHYRLLRTRLASWPPASASCRQQIVLLVNAGIILLSSTADPSFGAAEKSHVCVHGSGCDSTAAPAAAQQRQQQHSSIITLLHEGS